ncbi:hypothetical protein [Viridibacillus arvi]|uniref:hypothetical protein n=1 Tax=Viridibacillus arvi TaxID=263475 RepID=UPI0034CD515A
MDESSFQATVGFSVRDTLILFWLHSTFDQERYSVDIHDSFIEEFPGRSVRYEYVTRIARQLATEGALSVRQEHKKMYYQCTPVGKERLAKYQDLYFNRFHEILQVLDRIYYSLTKNGEKPTPPDHPLPTEFRSYFSKLLSVKDVIRYLALHLSLNRSSFYMAEVSQQLNDLFGWSPSSAYLYTVAREMEESDLLHGFWPDERRSVRHMKGTDAGAAFYPTITHSLEERVKNTRHYLNYILHFIQKDEN